MHVKFKGRGPSDQLNAVIAERLICWAKQTGRRGIFTAGPEPHHDATVAIWTVSTTHGVALCIEGDECDASSVPLVMYEGGPNLCPPADHADGEGIVWIDQATRPNPLTCVFNPTPPTPPAPVITSFTPGCHWGWSAFTLTLTGTGFTSKPVQYVTLGDDDSALATVVSDTKITARFGEIEYSGPGDVLLPVKLKMQDGTTVTAPGTFRLRPPGNVC